MVVFGLWRLHVVKETAVLVIGDDQQRLWPRRTAHERMEQLQHELLSGAQVAGRMIVIRASRTEREVMKVRVDPGHRWQIACCGPLEETAVTGEVAAVEVGWRLFLGQPV